MSLDLVTTTFANSGDKNTPPQTSPTGFVNFLDGYTRDYEISLASGNPQAKAVERQVQNYMFNQLTEMGLAWQRAAFPPWFASMSTVGGYQKNAIVVRQQPDLSWKPYRSLVDANVSDPISTPAQWEYVRNESESLALVPMPSGAGNVAAELITAGVNFNTLVTSGTYEIRDDAVFGASSNTPSMDGNYSGMLEVKAWVDSTPKNRVIQRYTSAYSRVFTRYSFDGVWTAWAATVNHPEVRNQKFTWCASSNSGNAYTVTPSPALTSRAEGMRLQFKASASNTGAATLNDGIGTKPILGMGGAALAAGNLLLNGNIEVMWNSTWADGSGGFGVWILIECDSAPAQIPSSSYLVASPAQFDATTKIATMEALKRQGLQASGIVTLNANTTLTAAAHVGASVISSAAGATAWTLPLANTVPAGGRIELMNAAAGTLTIQRQGANTLNGAGNSTLNAFTMVTGAFAVVESDGVSAWIVVEGCAAIPTPAQFANGVQSANTQFVQRALGSFSSRVNVNVSSNLTAAHVGNSINLGGTGQTINLPLASIAGASAIMFEGGTATNTLGIQGSDKIGTGQALVTSVPIPAGESLWLVSNGVDTWRMIAGSVYLTYSGLFGYSKLGNGYMKLPSGIIVQWGAVSPPSANTQFAFNFPIAFPTFGVNFVCSTQSSGNSFIGSMGSIISQTQGTVMIQNAGSTVNYIVIGW